MKKRYSILAAALAVGLWTAPASAAVTHYVSGNVGVSWLNDINDHGYYDDIITNVKLQTKTGFTALGAVGCDYGNYRIEGELGYQRNDIDQGGSSDNGEITIVSLLGNGYYDFDAGSGFTPYVTVGGGVAQVTGKDVDSDGDGIRFTTHDTVLAYQAGVGVAVPVADSVMLDARYRYFATTNFGDSDFKVSSNALLLGLRVEL